MASGGDTTVLLFATQRLLLITEHNPGGFVLGRPSAVPASRHRIPAATGCSGYGSVLNDGDGLLGWQIADQAQEAFDALQLPVAHVDLDRDAWRQARQARQARLGLVTGGAGLNQPRWRRT